MDPHTLGTHDLLDPEEQFSTLKLIDQRQLQLLEDLDRLNKRIETIIELYSSTRTGDDPASDSSDSATDTSQDVAA